MVPELHVNEARLSNTVPALHRNPHITHPIQQKQGRNITTAAEQAPSIPSHIQPHTQLLFFTNQFKTKERHVSGSHCCERTQHRWQKRTLAKLTPTDVSGQQGGVVTGDANLPERTVQEQKWYKGSTRWSHDESAAEAATDNQGGCS